MNATWKTALVALMLAVALLAGRSNADDAPSAIPDDLLKALAEAGEPGPGHAALQPLAGRWKYTGKFWMEPGQPPIETTGTIERKWILGGRFLEEKVAGTGFDGKPGFEGLGLLGYDNGQKQYTSTWLCNMGTGASNGVGHSESSGRFTFQSTCFCPVFKESIQGREEIRIVNDDKVVMESYKTIGGKDVKMMEIVAVRSK